MGISSSFSCTQLALKLSTPEGVEHCLEFRAGSDCVHTVGSAQDVDVSVPEAYPVHCYFERVGDAIYLVIARRDAEVKVDGKIVLSRFRIQDRCGIELEGLRLEVREPPHAVALLSVS